MGHGDLLAVRFLICVIAPGGSGAFCIFLMDIFDDYDLDELFTHLLLVDEAASLCPSHTPSQPNFKFTLAMCLRSVFLDLP